MLQSGAELKYIFLLVVEKREIKTGGREIQIFKMIFLHRYYFSMSIHIVMNILVDQ